MNKKILVIVVVIVAITIGYKLIKTEDEVTVLLDWQANTNHIGIYNAQAEGYFEEYGIEVKIHEPSGGTVEQLVASGEYDFGITYQENVIKANELGMEIVSVATIMQENLSGFAMKGENGQICDLENKTYLSYSGMVELEILEYFMTNSGCNFDSVEVVTTFLELPWYDNNSGIDFKWEYETWGLIMANEQSDLTYFRIQDYFPELKFYTPVIITSQKNIDENSEMVTNFISAITKGYQLVVDDYKRSAENFVSLVPEYDLELVEQSLLVMQPYLLNNNSEWGIQELTVYKNFHDFMIEQDIISEEVEVNEVFTNEFLITGE